MTADVKRNTTAIAGPVSGDIMVVLVKVNLITKHVTADNVHEKFEVNAKGSMPDMV